MLELRVTVPDRANAQILLAQVDGDLRSWPSQINVRSVTDPCLLAARDGSDLNASRNVSAPLLFGGGHALCVGEWSVSMSALRERRAFVAKFIGAILGTKRRAARSQDGVALRCIRVEART